MARTVAVFIVVMVALAGCNGFIPWIGDETGTPSPSPTEQDGVTDSQPGTDSTVTEVDTETTPDYLAPGVTADGVANPSLLLEHHYAIVDRESGNGTYTALYRSTRIELGIPSEETFSSRERWVVQYPDRWHYSWIQRNQTANETTVIEEWINESVGLLRVDSPDNQVQYSAQTGGGAPGHPPYLERYLERFLGSVESHPSVNVSVSTQVRNGSTVYVVTGTTHDDRTTTTSTLCIREDGYIMRYSQESTRELPSGDTVLIERQLTFEVHPDGELAPPNWTAEALASSDTEETDDQ